MLRDVRRDILGTLERARREQGDVVRLLVGPPRLRKTTYAFFHPDGVRHALNSQDERVRAEVAALGDRTPGAADVERLPYTTMVLKEAMRLYPPAWGFGRSSAGDDEVGGHHVPRGSEVIVSPWVTHRHPGFWDEPERFDPERFTPERDSARHRHAYFPFGAGPRACIGQYFSMLEAAILLAVIVRDHEIKSLADRVPLAPRITLHPAAPVLSRVRPLH